MGRRGPKPDYAKREAFARLLSEGVSLSQAAREVGINRRTAKRGRNGRALRFRDGRVLRGAEPGEVAAAFDGWELTDVKELPGEGLPPPLRRRQVPGRWLRLERAH